MNVKVTNLADELNKSIENILEKILFFPSLVSTILYAYLENKFLFFIPLIAYLSWVYYVCFIRVTANLSYTNERIYLERMRGTSYILSLPITFFFNFVGFIYRPDLIVFIFVTVMVGIGLIPVLFLVRWFFFRFDNQMSKNDWQGISKILMEVGIASIYYSLIVYNVLFFNIYIDQKILLIAVTSLFEIFLLGRFYKTNHNSILLCDQLSKRLSSKQWYNRYQRLLKKGK